MHGNPVNPGTKIRTRFESFKHHASSEKRLHRLHRLIARDPVSQPEKLSAVAPDQRHIGFVVARENGFDGRAVARPMLTI
jgi:hypothetical protein